MATITKTDSGKWKAIVRIKGWPKVSKTFRVKRAAQDWARTTEDEVIRGIYVPRTHSENLTVKKALERYQSEVLPTKKASTIDREMHRIKLLTKTLGSYSLASLNTEIIAKYRDNRLTTVKPNTVRLELALLSHLYNTAIKEWGVGLLGNPVLNVKKPSSGAGRNRRLEENEEIRLLAACKKHSNPFFLWIVKIALYTAMRRGEIITLTRKQVNLDKRIVFLPDTKNNTVRTVPLTNKALAVFKEVINHPIKPNDTDYLFYGEPGRSKVRKPYDFSCAWSNALKEAKIENLTFHDLRHEATSRLVEAGLSDQEVSSIRGHKSMQMLKRYTHLRTESLVDKIADI